MHHQPRIVTARSPRRTPRQRDDHNLRLAFPHQRNIGIQQFSSNQRATPPHLLPFTNLAPRPSPDEMMDIQGLPIV